VNLPVDPSAHTPRVQIKGIRDGLLVSVGEGTWPEIRQALLETIDQQASFLQGARLVVDVGNHILRAAELGHLRDVLSDKGVILWAVLSNSPTTEQTAQTLGLATRVSKPRPERSISSPETRLQGGEAAVLVKRTLRSGFSLQHEGHVIIIGDVNPGAQIIATGDVLVWGRLRGVVHAGADGDESAQVWALDLSPTQLRIAGQIAITPQRRGKSQPEVARIQDGQVVAEPWDTKGK
jgi:septum site-determining protein MinC